MLKRSHAFGANRAQRSPKIIIPIRKQRAQFHVPFEQTPTRASLPTWDRKLTRIHLVDSGLDTNRPTYVLLHPSREVDVILNMDASSNVQRTLSKNAWTRSEAVEGSSLLNVVISKLEQTQRTLTASMVSMHRSTMAHLSSVLRSSWARTETQ